MRIFPIQIITVLIILFCISCSSQSDKSELSSGVMENPLVGVWQDNATPPFKFELEQTFGDNEEIMFPQVYQLQGPVSDSAGNIYIIDGQEAHFYSFDPEGNVRWKKGEEGSLLYSMEHQSFMPEIGTISYIDEQGKVYTKIDEPYPQIRRYNLTINPPS